MEVKFTIFVFAVFANTGSAYNNMPPCYEGLAHSIRAACQAESGADLAVVDTLMEGNFDVGQKEMCYLKCIYDQLDAFLPDDTIDNGKLLDTFPDEYKENYRPMFGTCTDIKGRDRCHTALLNHQCYREHNQKNFFVV